MKQSKKPDNPRLNVVAARTGRALGRVARTVDGVKARHPHPLDEAREALAAGRKRVVKTTSAAATKTRKVVKRVKKAVKGAQKAVRRSASRLTKR